MFTETYSSDSILGRTSQWFAENKDHYIKDRAILWGAPTAVVSCIACGIFFGCASATSAALFGAVNYVVLTSAIEILHNTDHSSPLAVALGSVTLSGMITHVFLTSAFRLALAPQATFLLTIAAFIGGQCVRAACLPLH